MMDAKEIPSKRDGASAWLVTFADISALMLAFFVMMFAMSSLDPVKWRSVIARATINDHQDDRLRPPPNSSKNIPTVDIPPALPLGYLSQVLGEKLKLDDVLGRALIHRLDELVIVSLPSDVLFRPGKAELTVQARDALFRLSSAIAQMGNQVDVYGHAMMPATAALPVSAWHLSLARAVAVANELKRRGYRQNITMLGLGESRFKHLDPDIPAARREELARRVDIVIHPTEGEP